VKHFTVRLLETVQEIRSVDVDVPDDTSVEGIKAAAIEAAVQSQDHARFLGVKGREVLTIKEMP